MANVNVTLRMDAELKNQATELPREEVPNATTLAALRECEEIALHPEQYKSYNSVDELMQDLMAE